MIEFEGNKVIGLNAQYGKRLSEGRDEYVAAGYAIVGTSVWQTDLPFALDQIGYEGIQ